MNGLLSKYMEGYLYGKFTVEDIIDTVSKRKFMQCHEVLPESDLDIEAFDPINSNYGILTIWKKYV